MKLKIGIFVLAFFGVVACTGQADGEAPTGRAKAGAASIAGAENLPVISHGAAAVMASIAAERFLELAGDSMPRLARLTTAERIAVAKRLEPLPVPLRVAAWVFLQVGMPYQGGYLGEGPGNPPDTDPLIAFEKTDCTIMMLVAEALAHSIEYGSETAAMTNTNYRGGEVSFANRLHFTTDRLDSSPFNGDITVKLGVNAVMSAPTVLNQKKDGGRWIDIPWSRPRVVSYIPLSASAAAETWIQMGRLPKSCGVAFVKRSMIENGLDCLHEGFLWEGRLLVHASSKAGRVVAVSWRDFLDERRNMYDGVIFYEFI